MKYLRRLLMIIFWDWTTGDKRLEESFRDAERRKRGLIRD